MSKTESNIQREIMLACSKAGITVWRNNTGKAWQGKPIGMAGGYAVTAAGQAIQVERGILLLEHRLVEFGLCEGSSDLIGIRPIHVGPNDIGRRLGQFVAIEVKSARGRTTDKQRNFIDHIETGGGLAVLARSPEDIPT